MMDVTLEICVAPAVSSIHSILITYVTEIPRDKIQVGMQAENCE